MRASESNICLPLGRVQDNPNPFSRILKLPADDHCQDVVINSRDIIISVCCDGMPGILNMGGGGGGRGFTIGGGD